MLHADVVERLEAAAVHRGGMLSLARDASPDAAAVRDHLAGCAPCRQEAVALRVAAIGLDAVAADDVGPAPEARDRILAAVRTTGMPRPQPASPVLPAPASLPAATVSAPRRMRPTPAPARPPRPLWLGLAAAAALLLFVLGAALGGALGLAPGSGPAPSPPEIASVVQAVDRVLAADGRRTARLRDGEGRAAGSVLFDPATREMVVVSAALEPSADTYHCFVERDGRREWVGYMHQDGDASWWVGPVEEPRDLGTSGDRFVVVRGEDGPVVLAGAFDP
jgi:hypothetical protein